MTPSNLIIRAMQQADMPACFAIAYEAWGREMAIAAQPDMECMFGGGTWKPFFYVAEVDRQIVAMGGYGVSWLTWSVYDLFWHAVRKSHRKQGIGRAMVDRRLADLKPVASVVMIATKIPEYYSRFWGFKNIAELPVARDKWLMLLNLGVMEQSI